MPIQVSCQCGAKLKAQDEHAGKKTKCPRCGTILTIPSAEGFPEEAPVAVAPVARKSVRRPPPPEEEDIPDVLPANDPEDNQDTFEDLDSSESKPRRRKKRSRSSRAHRPQNEGGGSWGINAGIGGGLLMMILSVVWFVGGAMLDIYFIYPPILFIIGLIAFIKGFVDLGRK